VLVIQLIVKLLQPLQNRLRVVHNDLPEVSKHRKTSRTII